MLKKTFIKVTAVLVCFVFLFLIFPGTADAKPKAQKFDLNRILKKPVLFFASLLSYVPIFDIGGDLFRSDRSVEKNNSRMKITGDLDGGRPSGGD